MLFRSFAEALAAYLGEKASNSGASIVAETWGSIRVEPKVLKALLDEDDWLGSRS